MASVAFAATPNDTLVIQQSADTPTMDPVMTYDTASGSFVENIYETLVQYKGSSIRELEPMLATKWTQATVAARGPWTSARTSSSTAATP
jgi:peptide/nickel transport system substrate-binding protein